MDSLALALALRCRDLRSMFICSLPRNSLMLKKLFVEKLLFHLNPTLIKWFELLHHVTHFRRNIPIIRDILDW